MGRNKHFVFVGVCVCACVCDGNLNWFDFFICGRLRSYGRMDGYLLCVFCLSPPNNNGWHVVVRLSLSSAEL